MALTVSQYNSILRQYEEHQTRNRHLHDQRLHHIYETVPGYQALDEAVASTSVAQGKRMLAGDTNALAQLKDQLKDLAQKRASLLLENGYPTDFLDPIYDCPDCQDTGYVNGQKCHCFRQAEIALLYEQSNLKRMLEKENFGTLSYSFFQGDELTSYRQAVEKPFLLWYSRYGQDIPDQLHCKGMYRAGLFCALFQCSIPFRLTRQEHV